MIHTFSAQNFYSIGKKIEVNLESSLRNPLLPDLYACLELGNPVTKVAFFGGGNASGKTNILRILAFLSYMMSGSSMRLGRVLPFVPFLSKETISEPSILQVSFSMDKEAIYMYEIKLVREKIISEHLNVKRNNTLRVSTVKLFSREWNDKEERYVVTFPKEGTAVSSLTEKEKIANANQRASMVALFSLYDTADGIFRRISNYWQRIFSNIMQFGSTEAELSLTRFAGEMLAKTYEDDELKNAVSEVLKKFDIGFSRISKDEQAGVDHDEVDYEILHIYNNNSRRVGLELESNGTKRMIVLLRYVMAALLSGGVAVIDELDAFLHPDIFDYIIDMFMNPMKNSRNAQLIFSAHNYSVLSSLEKQQIFLSDRDENGETDVWRLDDMKDIRTDENYYTHYLANCYGGKPRIGG